MPVQIRFREPLHAFEYLHQCLFGFDFDEDDVAVGRVFGQGPCDGDRPFGIGETVHELPEPLVDVLRADEVGVGNETFVTVHGSHRPPVPSGGQGDRMYTALVLAKPIEAAYGSGIMVNAARTIPDNESLLKEKPVADWTRQDKDTFCWIVLERRNGKETERGLISSVCKEFNVKPGDYQNWRVRLEKTPSSPPTNGNGHTGNGHAAHEDNGHESVAETPSPTTETVSEPLETVRADQADTRSRLSRLLEDADALAMQLEKDGNPLAEALGHAVWSARSIMWQLEHDGVVAKEPTGMTPAQAFAVIREALMKGAQQILTAQETYATAETVEEQKVEAPEPAAVPPAEQPAVVTEKPADIIIPAPPARIEGPVETPRTPATIVAATRNEAAHTVTPSTPAPAAPKPEKAPVVSEREKRERAFVTYIQLKYSVGIKEYRRAVDIAMEQGMQIYDRRHRQGGIAERLDYEKLLKTAIEQFNPNADGDLWRFVGERVQAGGGQTGNGETTNKPDPVDVAAHRSVERTSHRKPQAGDESKHRALFGWMAGRYDEEPTSIAHAVEIVLAGYKGEILTKAAEIDLSRSVHASLDEILQTLSDSVSNSLWFFDPRLNSDLDGYVRKGFALSLKRKFGGEW